MECLKSRNASLPLFLFLLTVATRVPFSSKLLYHMDSVHFALALERYDVTVHQPHPPGYFLYVMLGRLIHLFIADPNGVFVFLSILFSALTVAVIHRVATEMYDRKTGVVAAGFAITSPNLWFHGEIALSYGLEACFSALLGLYCWRVYRGRDNDIWVAAMVLGIAGGIRQNSVAFLLPLLLLSARKVPLWKVGTALLLLGAVCSAWFVPMVQLTGGWKAYQGAFDELWKFNTGHHSVFERGWQAFIFYAKALFDFTAYSIGAGVFALVIAACIRLLHGKVQQSDPGRPIFFAAWALPSVLFYLLIFVHPANPGYALVFTPPLLLLCARAVVYGGAGFKRYSGNDATVWLTSLLLLANTGVFLFSPSPVSWQTIRNHDRNLAAVLTELQAFDPATTAFFVLPYLFIGFRQVMYYLPQYRVYQVNMASLPSGEQRSIFWGVDRNTYLTKEIELPQSIRCFATVLASEEGNLISGKRGIIRRAVNPQLMTASGPIDQVPQIFPVRITTCTAGPI